MRFSTAFFLVLSLGLLGAQGCRSPKDPPKQAANNQNNQTAKNAQNNAAQPEAPKPPEPAKTNGVVLPEQAPIPEIFKPVFKAALEGPDKVVQMGGEKWTVRRALVMFTENQVEVKGRLSHHIPLSPGDQMDYHFIFKDGKLTKNDVNIKQGGWLPILGQALNTVNNLGVARLPVDGITGLYATIEGQLFKGGWEAQGQQMALAISLEAYRQHMLKTGGK